MEMIIGCIVLALFIVFLQFFCKNATFTVKIEYPEIKIPELAELYNEDGELKEKEETFDFDNMLKEINELMTDQEDTNG